MANPELPLFHLAARPTAGAGPPPLAILLHGYGSNEHDLFDLADLLDPRLLVVSLRAPLVLGHGAFAWFEIAITAEGIAVDDRQAERSRAQLAALAEQAPAAYGADPRQVYLIGFSQGATMAALLALSRPDLVAGAAVISAITPGGLLGDRLAAGGLERLALLVQHGVDDGVVPVEHGRATRDLLAHLPSSLSYHEYRMPHTIAPDALRDLQRWLGEQIDRRAEGGA